MELCELSLGHWKFILSINSKPFKAANGDGIHAFAKIITEDVATGTLSRCFELQVGGCTEVHHMHLVDSA
jgi:hypothetical protein